MTIICVRVRQIGYSAKWVCENCAPKPALPGLRFLLPVSDKPDWFSACTRAPRAGRNPRAIAYRQKCTHPCRFPDIYRDPASREHFGRTKLTGPTAERGEARLDLLLI